MLTYRIKGGFFIALEESKLGEKMGNRQRKE